MSISEAENNPAFNSTQSDFTYSDNIDNGFHFESDDIIFDEDTTDMDGSSEYSDDFDDFDDAEYDSDTDDDDEDTDANSDYTEFSDNDDTIDSPSELGGASWSATETGEIFGFTSSNYSIYTGDSTDSVTDGDPISIDYAYAYNNVSIQKIAGLEDYLPSKY